MSSYFRGAELRAQRGRDTRSTAADRKLPLQTEDCDSHNMLWTRDSDSEKPPLSNILPRLYLGAESDVTQDCLSSLGISYVLSVSRCSPQPSFLPRSRYLRIPIDDSLWDDLLPWIPEALSFIDGAMSSGASVLVHCAAGISRSPALAVAYIMYSLGLDLDQAYRFVKERRPSISPNFNFLGQLQLFQSTLSLNRPAGGAIIHHPDSNPAHSEQQSDCYPAHNEHHPDRNPAHNEHHPDSNSTHSEHQSDCHPDCSQQRAEHQEVSDLTDQSKLRLRLEEGGVRRLHETLNLQQRARQVPPSSTPAQKPFTLQLPASSASLQDKRKSLTLSLTPLGVSPAPPAGGATTSYTVNRHSKQDSHRQHSAPHRPQKEQGLLSPFSFSLNKLLDWGERLLLGGLFVPPVKMGQPALPYRC